MKENSISVIIPMLNAEKTIKDTIRTIEKSDRDGIELEIIVVDNGSTDQSVQIVEELSSEIIILKEKKKGSSAARNAGLKAARGKYIAFIDADDRIKENYFKLLLEGICDADMAVCGFDCESETGTEKLIPDCDTVSGKAATLACINNVAVNGYLWNKMFCSRIIIENSLLFNEELYKGEDLLFNFQYLQHAEKVRYIKESLYSYKYWGGYSQSINKKNYTVFKAYNYCYDISPDEGCKKALIPKFISLFLVYYAIANKEDRHLLQSYLEKFISSVECDDINIKKELQGKFLLRWKVFCINSNLYTLLMRISNYIRINKR